MIDEQAAGTGQIPPFFVRFSRAERLEHLLIIVSFTVLVATGLPQKFFGATWAQALVPLLGGIQTVRFLHRAFALIFCLEALYHVGFALWVIARGRFEPTMVPGAKDIRDAIQYFGYCIGVFRQRPMFGRFDFRHKFEYWGVVMGGSMIIVTGLMLIFPVQATAILPGFVIPAARELHGGEAILAFATILIWHLYSAHLNPERFPGDTSVFTGKISRQRMVEEHPLEFVRLTGRPLQSLGQAGGEAATPVFDESEEPEGGNGSRV
ncbi:MAG: formate dehydrogenase subunit gamma [Chloroflexota bacterium]